MATYHEELQQQQQQQSMRETIREDGLVARLRMEKKILLNKIHQEGYELGIRTSSNLTTDEFKHFERVVPLVNSFDEDVLEYLWTFLDMHGYPDQVGSLNGDVAHLLDISPQSRILFAQGWLAGVVSVWQMMDKSVEG